MYYMHRRICQEISYDGVFINLFSQKNRKKTLSMLLTFMANADGRVKQERRVQQETLGGNSVVLGGNLEMKV